MNEEIFYLTDQFENEAKRIVQAHGIKELFVGIDPGKEGAIFGYQQDLKPVFCQDIPMRTVTKVSPRAKKPTERKIYDRRLIINFLKLMKAMSGQCRVVILLETPIFPAPKPMPYPCTKCGEKVWTRQHNAPASTVEQWAGYFLFDMGMYCLDVVFKTRTPVQWQDLVYGKSDKGAKDPKEKSRNLVIETFGDLPIFYGVRGGQRPDRFDAAAIALAASINQHIVKAENKITVDNIEMHLPKKRGRKKTTQGFDLDE